MRLIDADVLKAVFIRADDDQYYTIEVKNVIDNSPTVETYTKDDMTNEYLKGYNACKDIIQPTGEWIPVSERLPEERINPYTNDFDEVLCTTDRGDVQAFKFGAPIIYHEPHFWLGGAIMDEHIIAWQYKPEPYKKGEEE